MAGAYDLVCYEEGADRESSSEPHRVVAQPQAVDPATLMSPVNDKLEFFDQHHGKDRCPGYQMPDRSLDVFMNNFDLRFWLVIDISPS